MKLMKDYKGVPKSQSETIRTLIWLQTKPFYVHAEHVFPFPNLGHEAEETELPAKVKKQRKRRKKTKKKKVSH